jgi:O-antigen/teichoic acid export membrane protein
MTLKTGIYNNLFWRSLQIISTLVLNILIARYLGAAGSGSFFYLVTVYTIYIQVGGLSLESALGFFSSNKKIPVKSLAAAALAWAMILTCIAVAAFVLSNFQHPISNAVLANMTMFVAGNLLTNYFSSIFFAEMNFKIPNLFGTAINVALTIFIAILILGNVHRTNHFLVPVFFSSFLLRGLFMVICFYRDPQHQGKTIWITKSQVWMLVRYSGLAYISNLVFFILYRIDYYFVERYCSPAELGNYIQVCRIAQMFFLFPAMIATVVFPLTSSKNNNFAKYQLPAITRILFYTIVLASGFLVITGSWLFPIVFGDEFKLMYSTFVWLVPGIIGLSILYPFTAYYSGINQISTNLKGSLLAMAVIVSGDMLLIPQFGIQSAAAVSSVGYICYQLFVMIRFRNKHNISSREFFYFEATDFHRISKSFKLSLVVNEK